MRKYKKVGPVYDVFDIHTKYRRLIGEQSYAFLKRCSFKEVRLVEEILINKMLQNRNIFL